MLNVRASRTYSHMLERCFNSLDKNYYNYGERSITVDKEWINNPTAFFNWYKENWFEGGQVDRIDNDGPYSESNCRIVDAKTNNRNRRNTMFVTAFGEAKTCSEWIEDPRCVINEWRTLRGRIKAGWNSEEAITTLVKNNGRRPATVNNYLSNTNKQKYEAFGESKNISAWFDDDRNYCDSFEKLYMRVRRGYSVEEAMSKDFGKDRYAKTSKTQRNAAPQITAFGESKSLADWADDPRCTIEKRTLHARLKDNWPAEDAIVTPKNGRYRKM